MKSEPKPLIYPFENPSMTVGLATLNATEPPFKVEPRHLDAWFKEGTIARYMLMDDIRELWNREGFGEPFEQVFGKVKNCKLIANCRTDMVWSRIKAGETPTYGVFCIDTAEALYLENCEENPSTARNDGDKPLSNDHASFKRPMPEPVLPRYEAQKIYAMIHGLSASEATAKKQTARVTGNQSRALVSALKVIGFTDDDFTGEITALQAKLTRKRLGELHIRVGCLRTG